MALDSNDIAVSAALSGAANAAAQPSVTEDRPRFDWGKALMTALLWASRLITRGWIARKIGTNLRRRILLANIVGLAGLLFAMLYLSLHHGWLLDAKVDVVKTVSRITSEAIAYRAVNERAIFDPNRLPEKTATWAQRDDAFAALELPIDPHLAAVLLRKLVGPASLNARIYSAKGTLIINSETLFSDDSKLSAGADNSPAPRLRNFWTRLNYWVINKELKVYRELGTANGFLYPEVKKAAQQGIETPILLLNKRGQQIVSMAEPIKRGNKILGVLLVSTKPGDIDDVLWDERWLIL
jgi:two-component system sensor histidine kinase ChvG